MASGKTLVIVESPAKAKTINKYLGSDYKVLASIGHVVDLPKSRLGVDVENRFQPDYIPMRDKAKIINELKAYAEKSNAVLVATDPDREGEAIAWHLKNLLEKKNTDIQRIEFNEITKNAVQKALQSPREIDYKRVESQQARRVLDRLVGYKVSPLLWKTIARGLSAGRVQSVALRLLCEREEDIEKFVEEEYWNLFAEFLAESKETYRGKLIEVGGEKVGLKNFHIKSGDQAVSLKEEVLSQRDLQILKILKKKALRNAPAPYITSSLQQDAIRKLNMTARQVMRTAQQLYEGIDCGPNGSVGLITYMRTDSTRIAGEAIQAVRSLIGETYGSEFLPAKPRIFSKKKKAQDAHEAIRPTYINPEFTPEKLKKYLKRDQLRLYTLIWNRFLACQMKPAQIEETTILTGNNRFVFETKGERQVFPGFRVVYELLAEETQTGDEKSDKNSAIPHKVKEEEPVTISELETIQEFTRPPARYTESSLVKKLDQLGIGRPSTYAQIISTLLDRNYALKEAKKLHPTDLGRAVNQLLIHMFPDIFNVKFTAMMEEELDLIENADENYLTVMEKFYKPFSGTLEKVENNIGEIRKLLEEPSEETCEKCGSPMIIKWGRNGRFLACSNYPACKNTRPLVVHEPEKLDENCPQCGQQLVKRKGRFGEFIACSNYPECKYTKPVTLGVKCPKDGCDGEIVQRRSKRGKKFYGCSRYPKCDFVSWYLPVNQPCPHCGHPFMYDKETKRDGRHYYCPTCKTKHPVAKDS